jgi:radical SAM protein with 4Fe4S-binding SPASM domain
MMFNPLTLLGRATKFRSLPTQPPDLHNFVRDFLRVAEIAEWLEVILISDFLPKFLKDHRPQELACSACAAELNLSEDGYLVACTRTLALGAPEGNPFIFGYFDRSTGDFILDETKISRLRGRTVLNMQNAKKISACENCLIKWDCSGDCLNELYLTNRDFYQVVPGRCREKLFFARNYLRYLAGREFIQIKPYLKKEAGQLFLVGYFNRFLLGDSKQTTDFRYNPYIKISLKKDPLKEIYHKILAYQKQFFSRPVLFLIEVEEDLSHRRIAAVLESFIRSLKQSGLIFRIVKPLSRVLSADFSRTYDIPETCFDCRALFSVEAGRVIFCDGQQGQNLEDYATRDQIFNEFSGINPGCLNLKV